MKIIFLFIDGLGVGAASAENPVNAEVCPTLWRLIKHHSKPIDACLGVSGLPQSATGQATMFTGVNCPAAIGRHSEGFPGIALRRIIETNNLFMELRRRGKKVKFADAYMMESVDDVAASRFKSVTTVMALTTPEVISTLPDLLEDGAVTQDLTRETLQEGHDDVPIISPKRAAEHLFRLACKNDFTLYEFFQTDVAGHSMDYARACGVLRAYDKFLTALTAYAEASGITVVATADHGNVESMLTRGHTRNPVPFIAFGPRERVLRARVESLQDVTPAILEQMD